MSKDNELAAMILDLRNDVLTLRKEVQDIKTLMMASSGKADLDVSAAGVADADAALVADADKGGASTMMDRGSDVDQEN